MKNIIKNNQGYFLVAVLLLLLMATLTATGLIYYMLSSGTKPGSGEIKRVAEISLVDSCLNGAIARMTDRNSRIYLVLERTPSSPQWQAQLKDNILPELVADSLPYKSVFSAKDSGAGQKAVKFPSDTSLAYSIILNYKTSPGGRGIYYYLHSAQKETLVAGPSFPPPDQYDSPIYLALITGTAGNASRSIEVSLTLEPAGKSERLLKQLSWREVKTD